MKYRKRKRSMGERDARDKIKFKICSLSMCESWANCCKCISPPPGRFPSFLFLFAHIRTHGESFFKQETWGRVFMSLTTRVQVRSTDHYEDETTESDKNIKTSQVSKLSWHEHDLPDTQLLPSIPLLLCVLFFIPTPNHPFPISIFHTPMITWTRVTSNNIH